jgi:hypothetical protein
VSEARQLLQEHLASARFRAGELRGRWRLLEFVWPHVFVDLVARDRRRFALRFECSGYPDQPPTAMPWDRLIGKMLSPVHWPRGGRVSQVFNPGWKNGSALYLPCDRESIAGHPNWYSEYPSLIWKPARGLAQYLEAVHEILQSHELVAEAA